MLKKLIGAIFLSSIFAGCQPDYAENYSTDSPTLSQGKALFELNCASCHNFRTSGIGPNLAGVTKSQSPKWLGEFIQNPVQMVESGDEHAVELFEEYKVYMPPFPAFKDEELTALLTYMNTYQTSETIEGFSIIGEPIKNPVFRETPHSGINLVLQEFTQAPPTSEKLPFTRINKMAPLPYEGKRLFIHDLRGILYEINGNELEVFLDLTGTMPKFIDKPGLGTGFGSFAFHPNYAQNGLFYTSHAEDTTSDSKVDFKVGNPNPVALQFVLTEWKQNIPEAKVFEGTQREVLRIEMARQVHAIQDIGFNPVAEAGNFDFGNLYITVGDGGSVYGGYFGLTQRKDRIWGSILRIDPLGNNSKNGQYGIPSDNPFVGIDNALDEIWAYGFRNPNRIIWDIQGDGKMLATCIGQSGVDELNWIVKGANYGWPEREGTFRLNKVGDLKQIFPLPADDSIYDYTYPVAQIDHDDINAIAGGYVYRGSNMPELRGKYLFGGIVNGRIFMLDASELKMDSQAPIEELGLALENGQTITMQELAGNADRDYKRAGLRLGEDADGELYLFSKANGKIFKVIGIKKE